MCAYICRHARCRLPSESRIGGPAEFDIEYGYDAGGNRTSKKIDSDLDTNWDEITTYFYDTDLGASYPHRANRLMYSETRTPAPDNFRDITESCGFEG